MNIAPLKISYWKIFKLVIYLAVAVLAAYFLQPWYRDSKGAGGILISVFSILSGFLVAVMAIVASDKGLRGRNWREDTYFLQSIKDELFVYQMIFYIFLSVLIFAFLTNLSTNWGNNLKTAFEYILIFLATLGILISFNLPGIITSKYVKALKLEIENRKKNGNRPRK